MNEDFAPQASQEVFETCYRGRQSRLHHMAYMRMGKVLLALKILQDNGVDLEDKRVFDYGFGAGTLFHYLPRTCAVYGVEQDPCTVQEVRDVLMSRNFRCLDLQTIDIASWESHPLLALTYDIVICSHVLEHLPDPVHFLRRIRSCIEKDGIFLGLVPINERKRNVHHLWAPTRDLVGQWAKDAGVKMLAYEENDPWKYWVQPLFAEDAPRHALLARVISIGLGIPATVLGPEQWFKLGRVFAMLTRSRATQAAFLLRVP